jgi:precorrin-6A/cobalt-precorrin-6A reductase
MIRALILGGTRDANLLAVAVAAAGLDAIYSYAGRTQVPVNQPLPTRKGGFGGAEGLADVIGKRESRMWSMRPILSPPKSAVTR